MYRFFPAGQAEGQTSPGQMVDEPIHPVNIPRREKDFQGMLEYKKEDELKLVKNLILGKKKCLKADLKPSFIWNAVLEFEHILGL